MKTLHLRRHWVTYAAVFAASVLLTSWVASLMVAADNGQRAADRARDQARAQASIVADQRAAQSRRIDALSRELARTRAQVSSQAKVVGRQEQAIRDLAAQVDQLGGDPVTSSVTKPRATKTQRPTSTSAASTSSRSNGQSTSKPRATQAATPKPQPAPAPDPHDSGGLLTPVCNVLPLIDC